MLIKKYYIFKTVLPKKFLLSQNLYQKKILPKLNNLKYLINENNKKFNNLNYFQIKEFTSK